MKLQSYPVYKDSGITWLGEVPTHWELRRGKTIFDALDIRSATGEEELLTVSSERGVIPRSTATVTMFKAESYVGYKLCWPGDLVINSLWAWARGLGVSKHHGIVSSAYGVYRLFSAFSEYAGFIHYLVRSRPFQWELQVRSKGIWTSRLQLTDESFLTTPFPLPEPDEQAAIVRFLDYADRRIRRYILAKQKLIKLLEEQKQAIIHRAVTRGLDPNVSLKPSGVEWLGDIPEHWEVISLRYLATKFGSGITPRGGSTVYQEAGIPFLRSQNIHFDGLRLEGVARISSDLHKSLSGTHVRPGDVLLNITGASIGRVCYVPDDFSEGNVNQHVCIIRPLRDRIHSSFLAAFLSTPFMQQQIRFEQNGASREGLTLQSIRDFKILIPRLTEQQQIITLIQSETHQLNNTIHYALHQIDLIREYRTRLIADVVTGKFDVRDVVSQLPEEWEALELIDEVDDIADSGSDEVDDFEEELEEAVI